MHALLACLSVFIMDTLVSADFLSSRSDDTPVQCLSNYTWMENEDCQNPCEVAAELIGACGSSTYSLSSLQVGWVYTGPTGDEANECICNPVVYNLVAACGACQDRSWVNWFLWQSTCNASVVTLDGFPETIPADTSIPEWAMQNVTGSKFNLTEAEDVAAAFSATSDNNPTGILPPSTDLSSPSLSTWIIVVLVLGILALVAGIAVATILVIAHRRKARLPQAVQHPLEESEELPAYTEKDAPGYSSNSFSSHVKDGKEKVDSQEFAMA